jgi:hypothetical protein
MPYVTEVPYSTYFLLADEINIFRVVNSPDHCTLLQSDTNSKLGWYAINFTKFSMNKTYYFLKENWHFNIWL